MFSEDRSKTEAMLLIDKVRKHPGFVALCRIIGRRIEQGQAYSAFKMMVAMGASPALANHFIERWPIKVSGEFRRFVEQTMTIEELAACRVAQHIDDIDRVNWSEKTRVAVTAGWIQSG